MGWPIANRMRTIGIRRAPTEQRWKRHALFIIGPFTCAAFSAPRSKVTNSRANSIAAAGNSMVTGQEEHRGCRAPHMEAGLGVSLHSLEKLRTSWPLRGDEVAHGHDSLIDVVG